jgi:hypothetical protein
MRRVRKAITAAGLLSLALLPLAAAVSPEAATSVLDAGPMPIAIAQPRAIDSRPLAAMSAQTVSRHMQPESGLLVVVGSALFGLASLVRRTTK